MRIDTAFDEVVRACADPRRPHGWITGPIRDAYGELHRLGWAHSVEAWDDDGLAGGLYGVSIGGLFAGESMFHRRTDASKVALVSLVECLRADEEPDRLLDVQWLTEHLASLGAIEVSRRDYLGLLGFLLGNGGRERDAGFLRGLAIRSAQGNQNGMDGLLAGYMALKPAE